jgi:tripartite-type tricarboxylate transporter receptor subunit TctC
MTELQAGRIDFMCEISSTAKPHVDAGSVRALAIFQAKRSPALPNLATAEEQGTKDLIAYTWNAIFAPKGTPADIVQKLNKAAVDAINTPAVKEKLAGLGAEVASGNETTPAYLGKLVKDETEKWAVPIKASGVSVE